jgi:imidazole glycerol-phosphate synthase subunit HisF
MFRPRLIPVLLLSNTRLVKTTGFKKPVYIGDPLNAVRIFNELKADELVILDIEATKHKKTISTDLVKKIGEEANMPISVGGGIGNLESCEALIKGGAERIVLSTQAVLNPKFVEQCALRFGSSSISVCIDYKKNLFGKKISVICSGEKNTKLSPLELAKLMNDSGAGELIIQSIEHDGKMTGYDIETLKEISESIKVPVIALGGAGSINDFRRAYIEGNATAMAAGSFFVFKGSQRGVLINYPDLKLRTFA